MQLVLASASPRRQQLLTEAGYVFVVHPAAVDETPRSMISPPDFAQKLACEKARAVAVQHPGDVILAADTVVAFGERIIGKPADAEDARRILTLLAGTTQIVITGVCVISSKGEQARRVLTAVNMRPLNREEIEAYVASGQWEGKAGAYGIQDEDPFVTAIAGSHSNVVGLPMEKVIPMLAAAGIQPQR